MVTSLNCNALKRSCLEVAKSIAWQNGPVNDLVSSSFAEILYQEALFYKDFVVNQGSDPNLITRAVNYLAHAHAIPPTGVDISWFRERLSVLIELACPNCTSRNEDEQFYQDIESGIRIARNNYA
jgi:hypothetical protein